MSWLSKIWGALDLVIGLWNGFKALMAKYTKDKVEKQIQEGEKVYDEIKKAKTDAERAKALENLSKHDRLS